MGPMTCPFSVRPDSYEPAYSKPFDAETISRKEPRIARMQEHMAPSAVVELPRMEWVRRARCASEDPELFFPVGSNGAALEQIRRAKAICWLCPVKPECLAWALLTRQDAGIWGGLTKEERRDIRRDLWPNHMACLRGTGRRSHDRPAR